MLSQTEEKCLLDHLQKNFKGTFYQIPPATCVSALGTAYLHADTSLEFELQSDHVHFLHRAELIKLRNFLGHLINRHFNRIQFCARLAYDLYSLLHVGEQVTCCTRAGPENQKGEKANEDSGVPLKTRSCISLHTRHPPPCVFLCLWVIFLSHVPCALTPLNFCPCFFCLARSSTLRLAMSSFSGLDQDLCLDSEHWEDDSFHHNLWFK